MLRKNLLLEVVMKVAVLGVFVENGEAIEKLNEILHGYRDCIMGRMGIPNVNEDLNVITLVIKAPKEKVELMIKEDRKSTRLNSSH